MSNTESADDIDPFRQALPASPPPDVPLDPEERPDAEAPAQPTSNDATLTIPSVTVPGRGGRPTLRDLKAQDVEEIKVRPDLLGFQSV